MNQADAAERVGLSRSYISEIESGDKKVSLAVLEKYSQAFDIPMSSLMLFAEQVEGGGKAEVVRVYAADKALRMLDWLQTLTDFRRSVH
jgi:transcriptional regulator with XRE-family HTH domain